jgi:hypothetical protein
MGAVNGKCTQQGRSCLSPGSSTTQLYRCNKCGAVGCWNCILNCSKCGGGGGVTPLSH